VAYQSDQHLRDALAALASSDPHERDAAARVLTPIVRSQCWDRLSYSRSSIELEDAAQFVWASLYRSAHYYDPALPAVPWIKTIAGRQISTEKERLACGRNQPASGPPISLDEDRGDDETSLRDLVCDHREIVASDETHEARQGVYKALRAILTPVEYRSLVGTVQGLSYAQIAERYDYTRKTVDNSIMRARRKLQQLASRKEIDLSDDTDKLFGDFRAAVESAAEQRHDLPIKTGGRKLKSREKPKAATPKSKGETMTEKTTTSTNEKIVALKCNLFDLIERQSMLAAENQRLEQVKTDLAKQLGEARQQQEAEAKTDKAAA
jgi:RNA polymerase sigma factor (sigma-70 family)